MKRHNNPGVVEENTVAEEQIQNELQNRSPIDPEPIQPAAQPATPPAEPLLEVPRFASSNKQKKQKKGEIDFQSVHRLLLENNKPSPCEFCQSRRFKCKPLFAV